jgi:hypothetical protein
VQVLVLVTEDERFSILEKKGTPVGIMRAFIDTGELFSASSRTGILGRQGGAFLIHVGVRSHSVDTWKLQQPVPHQHAVWHSRVCLLACLRAGRLEICAK